MKSAYILLSILTISITSCKSKQPCVANPKPDCMCTMQYDPVCGCDGKTYGNSCQAGCAGVTVVSKGECPEKK